jgi:hypothetical protein
LSTYAAPVIRSPLKRERDLLLDSSKNTTGIEKQILRPEAGLRLANVALPTPQDDQWREDQRGLAQA